jgi:hypothetical protein
MPRRIEIWLFEVQTVSVKRFLTLWNHREWFVHASTPHLAQSLNG